MFSVSLLSLLIVVTTAHSPVTKDTYSLFPYIVKLERTVAVLSTKLEAIEARVRENKDSTKMNQKEITKKMISFEDGLRDVNQTLARQKTDVAFEVSLSKDMNSVPDNVALKFSHVLYNKGNGFNPSTGIFTAPVSGTYVFWAHIMKHYKGRLHVFIMNNGKVIGQSHTNGAVQDGFSLDVPSITTVAFITKGDHVWFKKWGPSSSLRGDLWSSYGGVLIRSA